ncbi:MAG: hypothetical protein INR65_18510 [Gluconacetobacter diazotrophicus]|nr:hypothetical protein [Gluconacetobacter diazotrophicus]
MSGAAELVATLRDRVDAAEADWRRRHLPPPTREKPRPDPAALEGARLLEAAGRELDAIAAQLRALPPPGSAGPSEAEAAIRDHAAFLLDLLGTSMAVEPQRFGREVEFLRELAQRRTAALG